MLKLSSYCFDENGKLVHINSLSNETRHAQKLYCLQCGREMVANLGKIRVKHFSHKIDCACDGESYLHKLAKFRIREKFISEESFPITFVRDVPCKEHKSCPYYSEYCCTESMRIPRDLKFWDDKPVYSTCEEEKEHDGFRPDLLLTTDSQDSSLAPTFVEVYKTHKSNDSKLNSKYKIIETTQIKSEQDIDDIIERGFIEGENCTTHNFNPKFPAIRKSDVPIERFILDKNGKATVIYAQDYLIYCDIVFQKLDANSYRELNIIPSGWRWNQSEQHISLSSYEKGLLYLKKKGLQIDNCILCKYNKYNDYHQGHICIRYKEFGFHSPFPGQTRAKGCPKFELNQELMEYPMSELEKEVFEIG